MLNISTVGISDILDSLAPADLQLTATFDGGAWDGKLKDQVYGYLRTSRPSVDLVRAAAKRLREVENAGTGVENAQERFNEFLAGGAFKLSVLVTETDESKTSNTLIKIADYIGSQRQAIVEAVTK